MAGIIGIYGLVVSVLISDNLTQTMALYTGFIQLGAGLSVGLAGLAAGLGRPLSSPSSASHHSVIEDILTGRIWQLRYRHCR